ncbi:hypothetical protein PMAYCL1PPCAC_20456, partial [Pristionchus mayeri]
KEREKEKEELKQKEEELKQTNPEEVLNKKTKNQQFVQTRPWQPQIDRSIAIGDQRRSALSVEEQKRYVAIVANFHQIDSSTRFAQNRTDLKVYDDRLSSERQLVDSLVRNQLKDVNVSMKELHTEVEHVLQRWSARYMHDKSRFEKMKTIPWRKESEPTPSEGPLKPQLERMLMAAANPKLMLPPSMHDRLHVNYTPHRFDPRNKQSTKIGEDKALLSLCSDTGCSIAMECTTAVHLMTRPGEPRNYTYNIPISVFEQFRAGSAIRHCFLGKPRPQSGISNQTLLHMVAKYRVKSTFTKKEDPHPKQSSSMDTVAPAKSTVEQKEIEERGGFSLLDNLLGSILMPSSSSTLSGPPSEVKPSSTDHSYALFSIPSSTQPDQKVIMRSSPSLRNDAKGGTEYSLGAKVEFAAETGVMKETYEQMLWNSMKAVFKGAVNSATVHMHPFMKDALQISHSRAIPMGNQYNQELFPLMSTRTEHLSRLLGELSVLQPGEYLLQVSPLSDEMIIYREKPTGNELFFRKGPIRLQGSIKAEDYFTGIDDKRVLHWQVMQGRAPLTLWPEGHHILGTYEKREMEGKGNKRKNEPPAKKRRSEMTEEGKKQNNLNNRMRRKFNKHMEREVAKVLEWPRKDLDAPE